MQSWIGNDSSLTGQEVYRHVTMELAQLVESMRVNLVSPDPSSGKKFVMLDLESETSYNEKRHRQEWIAYKTMRPPL